MHMLTFYLLLWLGNTVIKNSRLSDIWESTNAHKCVRVYYIYRVHRTCFSHSHGHLQGGA
jgi:hypothetical protein